MANALRPSIQITEKVNVNPSIDRISEATAEDFKEIGQILVDHASKIDENARSTEEAKYYGIFESLAILQAAFPVAQENGWGVIDTGTGNPKNIATHTAGVWSVDANIAPIQYYTTKANRPAVGAENVFYVVKDEKILYLYYDGGYKAFGKDGANGLNAYQVAVAFGFVGTEPEWIANLEGKDNYELWLDAGNVGTYNDFFEASRGPEGVEGPAGPIYDDTQIRTDFAAADALKVDKVAGKGLSDENYSLSEKNKLAAIDAAHYGQPLQSTVELSAILEANASDKERRYVEDDLSDYFYDVTAVAGDIAPDDQTGGTGFWRKVAVGGETAASVKAKYESNADTNAFTDALLAKIDSITAIFTTALKTAYDTASSWVSTNGAAVLAHVSKFTVPLVLGKIPVSQADGSIVWEDKPTGGTDLSGELLFPAYPNTRDDGAITTNKILCTDTNGNLKLYRTATAPSPFLDEVIPDSYLPSTTGNFILNGAFFTPSMCLPSNLNNTNGILIEGQVINYATFKSDNQIICNVTTGNVEGLFDITLNNGLISIFNDVLFLVLGTVFKPTPAEWDTPIGNPLDFGDGSQARITNFQSLHTNTWNKEFDYTKDISVRFNLDESPLGTYTLDMTETFQLVDAIDGTIKFAFYLRVHASLGYVLYVNSPDNGVQYQHQSTFDWDIMRNKNLEIRIIGGIGYFYKGTTLVFNLGGLLTRNLKLKIFELDRHDYIDIKYIELAT